MNIKGILVIGVMALVAGLILYLPFYLWFRFREKSHPPKTKITRTGITFYGVMISVVLSCFAQAALNPDTAFGQFVSTSDGRSVVAIFVVLIGEIIGLGLRKRGYRFIERQEEPSE